MGPGDRKTGRFRATLQDPHRDQAGPRIGGSSQNLLSSVLRVCGLTVAFSHAFQPSPEKDAAPGREAGLGHLSLRDFN